MKEALAIMAGLVAITSVIPYIQDIFRGKTKPNIVSWMTWTILLGIGTAAAFAAHQPRSALLTLGDTICTLSVVVLGLKYGIAKLSLFDAGCQGVAILGLILWLVFDSPLIAIVFAITIDFIVALPTFRHSWLHPAEETWQTFGIGVVASSLALISLQEYRVSGWIFPVYLLLSNAAIAVVITYRRHQKGLSLAR